MEAAVRYLREGAVREDSAAPVMLVCDSLETLGGPALFLQILQGVSAAMQQGRSQARQLVLAAVDQPPSMYAEALQQLGAGAATTRVVDLYSDPYGWQQQAAEQGQQRGVAEPLPLEQLQQMLLQQRQGQPGGGAAAGSSADGAAAAGHQLCIVIDSLSTLLMRYPTMQVLQLLCSLASSPHVSCALALLHEDLHGAQLQASLQRLASCCVRLQPVGDLERRLAGREVLGAADFRYQRRTGRVRVERQLYARDPASGRLELFAPPQEAASISAQALVAHKLSEEAQQAKAQQQGQQQGQPSEEELAGLLGSTMRLSLTEQERQAREAVRLPYEHQGLGKQYQTQDFRQYLPVAAGGTVAGVAHQVGEGRLGHILYVRDSEGEHDSDEDPDEDLDV